MANKFLFIIISINLMQLSSAQILFCEEGLMNKFEFKDENVRDPFVSQLPKKEKVEVKPVEVRGQEINVSPPSFSVQGLVWGSLRPQAIIDNKIFNLGDEVSGAKIIDISREGVKVVYQSKIFVISPQTFAGASKKSIGR